MLFIKRDHPHVSVLMAILSMLGLLRKHVLYVYILSKWRLEISFTLLSELTRIKVLNILSICIVLKYFENLSSYCSLIYTIIRFICLNFYIYKSHISICHHSTIAILFVPTVYSKSKIFIIISI